MLLSLVFIQTMFCTAHDHKWSPILWIQLIVVWNSDRHLRCLGGRDAAGRRFLCERFSCRSETGEYERAHELWETRLVHNGAHACKVLLQRWTLDVWLRQECNWWQFLDCVDPLSILRARNEDDVQHHFETVLLFHFKQISAFTFKSFNSSTWKQNYKLSCFVKYPDSSDLSPLTRDHWPFSWGLWQRRVSESVSLHSDKQRMSLLCKKTQNNKMLM